MSLTHGSWFRLAGGLALWTLASGFSADALAQGNPVIDHEADPCWLADQFPQLEAGIQPGPEIQTAKVYFRSDKYPDFYYVEMTTPTLENFLAILPKPGPETERIIYYVEAVDGSFNSTRSAEFDPEIKDPCKRRTPGAYMGSEPGIVVGATKAGVAAIPPGFQAAGIAGFITAAGVSSGVGGGVGIGTAAIVAGAGAAAAGGVVVATSGETASTTAPASAAPTTTSALAQASTTVPVATTTAIVTTTSSPITTTSVGSAPTTSVPTTTSSGPSTTTTSPSTTTTSPSTTTTSPSTTTTSPSTTTTIVSTTTIVPTTTTTAPAPPVTACFTTTKLNSCVWQFDASCSSGPIVLYSWAIDPGGTMPAPRPPVNYSGQVVTVDWNPPPYGGCSGSPLISAQLTVTGAAAQTDSKVVGVNIDLKAARERGEFQSSFTSSLEIAPFDGTSRGFIVLNGSRADATDSSTPSRHSFRGVSGRNTIEAYTDAAGATEGFWKFDFSSAANFVSGSLRVESGSVLSLDGRSIVFRLSGRPGERFKFDFELSQ